jgi:hypothetical protein
MQRLLARGRDLRSGEGTLDLSDSRGQTIDFLLSARRDTVAAKRFFRKALAQSHVVNPRTITVDKNPAYPRAATEMKRDGELWRRTRMRQCKYLNNIVEQDHRRIKRLVRPGRAPAAARRRYRASGLVPGSIPAIRPSLKTPDFRLDQIHARGILDLCTSSPATKFELSG